MKLFIDTNKEINYSLISFSGGERHIQLDETNPKAVNKVIIQARITSPTALIDLLLVENALRNQYGKELILELELPYFPYSRQDRVCASGQAFSLEVMTNLLSSLRLNKIVTWDAHSAVCVDMNDAVNIDPAQIIQADPQLLALLQAQDSVLICPDKGAVARCTDIKEKLALNTMVFCEKRRNPSTGKIIKTEVLADDLSGQCAVITDDICDGGFTFIKIAEQLREKNVKKIVLFVTHGIFSKGFEVFDDLIDEVVTTDSFPQIEHSKLRVINFAYDFKAS